MTTDAKIDTSSAGTIEGGIDAVVIGASADGLAAAAYLGKAGLRTVLLGASPEIGAADDDPITQGTAHGEHLAFQLDPDVISDLGLYKLGLAYAARRLETTYFFENHAAITVNGDPARAFQAPEIAASDDAEAFQSLVENTLEMAAQLRVPLAAPDYDGMKSENAFDTALAHAGDKAQRQVMRCAVASIDDIIGGGTNEGPLRDLLSAEAAFRTSAAPHAPYSFFNLVKRWSGEASGLQGAIAYPEGGAAAIMNALRRAAQGAKVDIRASMQVRSIIIEWDGVAGVELSEGGQIRTPIVIHALDARRAFLETIGTQFLNIEFQGLFGNWRPIYCSALFHAKAKAADDEYDDLPATALRRLMFAPKHGSLRKAFNAARAGRVPEKLIVEAILPNAAKTKDAGDGAHYLSAIAHPLPFNAAPDEVYRKQVEAAIIKNLDYIAPQLSDRIEETRLTLPPDIAVETGADAIAHAAPPTILQQWRRANGFAGASGVRGMFFCGPEAQMGAGLSAAAGRRAAKAAIAYARIHGGAP